MRVLVRGGTGFAGRHVVWRSLLSGYDTVFTGRNLEAAGQVIEMARRVSPERQPVFQAEGNPPEGRFDAVIDCAGKVDLVGSLADYVSANVDRTKDAWAHARECGARTFVSVSSASVLFACRDQLGLTDGVPATPPGIHPYADSKALSETMLWARRGQGPAIRIIRPRGVYGPYDSGVLPRILKVARRLGGRFPLPAPEALASMTAMPSCLPPRRRTPWATASGMSPTEMIVVWANSSSSPGRRQGRNSGRSIFRAAC
jgi:nucleoside-diphosphate-sugar epimerase